MHSEQIVQLLNSQIMPLYKRHTQYRIKSPLYHYKNFFRAEQILQKKQLALTDYRELNDGDEITMGLKIIEKEVDKLMNQSKQSNFWKYFIENFTNALSYHSIHIFSFCEKGDHLPAWMGYGDNGKGLCLGFHQDYFQPLKEAKDEINVGLLKVIYNPEVFAARVAKYLQIADNILNSNDSVGSQEFAVALASYFLPLLPMLKDKDYETEREYRFFLIKPGNNPVEEKNIRECKECKKCAACNELIKKSERRAKDYKKYKRRLYPFESKYLCQVWLGPSLKQEETTEEVKQILGSSGYEVNSVTIYPSNRSYRS